VTWLNSKADIAMFRKEDVRFPADGGIELSAKLNFERCIIRRR
jgi:hypothetical protein